MVKKMKMNKMMKKMREKDDEENDWDEFDDEELFEGEDKNSYRIFCRNMIFCPLPTDGIEDASTPPPSLAMEDPSSPFAGEDDEVDQKFDSFLAEFPVDDDEFAYLRLR